MSSVSLFVYGSLKRGHENHRELGAVAYRGKRATAPGFALFQVGQYPVLVRSSGGVVYGELYAVPVALLSRLDEFEGCPWLYERRLIELSDGSSAFSYVMPACRLEGARPVPGGQWAPERASATA
jgi:gamma-glutamylaminecyclotransferase